MNDAPSGEKKLAAADTPLDDLPPFDRLAELRRVFSVYWRANPQPLRSRPDPALLDR